MKWKPSFYVGLLFYIEKFCLFLSLEILFLESKLREFLPVESGILGFGIWNTAQGFHNSING